MPKKNELDFSDLNAEPTNKKEPTKQKKKKSKRDLKKQELKDTLLMIPVTGESSKFISRSISECSATEFMTWAKNVACPLELNLSHYKSEQNRIDQFLKIVKFHRKNFFLSNPKAAKTINN